VTCSINEKLIEISPIIELSSVPLQKAGPASVNDNDGTPSVLT